MSGKPMFNDELMLGMVGFIAKGSVNAKDPAIMWSPQYCIAIKDMDIFGSLVKIRHDDLLNNLVKGNISLLKLFDLLLQDITILMFHF